MSIPYIYETLNSYYGDLNWWPAETPYEVMVGAVLTQNTAWGNVEKALAGFGDALCPQTVLDADLSELANIIRPAGFFNQKAVYLKALTAWYAGYNFDVPSVQCKSLEQLRPELLSIKGIGEETADSILLYAFGLPTFVVDAYTVRLCDRYPIDTGKGYDAVKAYFESHLPHNTELYKNYHAMIVINGKNHCRKRQPLCDTCPLGNTCSRVWQKGRQTVTELTSGKNTLPPTPVLDRFYDWVGSVNPLAGSKLAKAVTYAINQKVKLSAFLLDGRIELSNNFAENQIRPFVVGRKNFLFCDSVRGAKASAVVYSIVRTAIENGLNPYQYLLYLFTNLPTVLTKDPEADLSPFFPWSDEAQAKCKYAQGEKGQLSLLG